MATSSSITRTESSAVNLTSDFFMKNFYRYNRNVIKVSGREEYNSTELSYEDSRALKRAVAKLASYDYTEEENGDNIISTIKAFAETYNHALESSSSEGSDTYRQHKQLKALTEKYADDLEDIGITIEKDGKLSISDNILGSSSFKSVKKVFAEDSEYIERIRKIAKRMNNTASDEVYTMMTGCGGRLNIML